MPLTVSFRGAALCRTPSSKTPVTTTGKPRAHPEPYMCDFFENIWETSGRQDEEPEEKSNFMSMLKGVRTLRRRRHHERKPPLIDIAQVAHVLTSVLDYRSDYPPLSTEQVNIWATRSSTSESVGSTFSDEHPISHNIVSPIQSQKFPSVPQSAPQLRHSMIEDNAMGEPEDEDSPGGGKLKVSDLARSTSIEIVKNELVKDKKEANNDFMFPLGVDVAVPPPSSKNGSVVFSSVFLEKQKWSWSIRFLLGIHEPIRHALYVMDRFLEQSQQHEEIPTLERHTREFFAWFTTYFVEFLKCQHDIKARVLHPLIKLKYSTKQEILRTYDEIHHILSQIQLQEHALLSNNRVKLDRTVWLKRLDTLQKAIRRLNMTLHSVLNLEEKTLNPALSAAFTEKTFRSFVLPRLFRAVKEKKVIVPWIVERSKVWGGEAEQQSIQSMLPFSAKFMYKKVWRPYFVSNIASAMKHLNEFELNASAYQPERREEQHFGCVVQ
ncbi:hypothetical protein Poli38472_000679 [Pythium oligandrum]|uniref:Uncharacterized protein n=1 Tax=Pythium oligandrum TaxID=41045 RepID=A0A8K1CCD1_PYTOL|nr:hypothetical protein Poli38472_000679 [Pythium oligandrum]|eukprot:TMW60637.1 hypothetical protein Poli38472_000679 [Pythium oligandrum]